MLSFDPDTQKHKIKYETDGKEELLDLDDETIMLLDDKVDSHRGLNRKKRNEEGWDQVEALGVAEQRLTNLVISLDKIRHRLYSRMSENGAQWSPVKNPKPIHKEDNIKGLGAKKSLLLKNNLNDEAVHQNHLFVHS